MISNYSFSQNKLEIEITGLANNTGMLMLQLFDDSGKIISQDMKEIANLSCSFSFTSLESGKYAVRYYHDENLNGKMDTNNLGKPTEGYGFSNNVISKIGSPPFKKWLFELNENKKIELKANY